MTTVNTSIVTIVDDADKRLFQSVDNSGIYSSGASTTTAGSTVWDQSYTAITAQEYSFEFPFTGGVTVGIYGFAQTCNDSTASPSAESSLDNLGFSGNVAVPTAVAGSDPIPVRLYAFFPVVIESHILRMTAHGTPSCPWILDYILYYAPYDPGNSSSLGLSATSSSARPLPTIVTSATSLPPGRSGQGTAHFIVWPVVGGVVGGILLFLLFAAALYCLHRRRRNGYGQYDGPVLPSGSPSPTTVEVQPLAPPAIAGPSLMQMRSEELPTIVPCAASSGSEQ